jgi:hypothetical protein
VPRREIVVPAEDFWHGRFPEVCVLTGRPADRLVSVRFSHSPMWPWLLVPFGVLPALLAFAFTSTRLSGALPMTKPAIEEHRRRKRNGHVAGVLSLLLVLGAALLSEWPLAAAGLVGLLLAVGIYLVADLRFVSGRPQDHGRQVVLQRVHEGFAAAVARPAP